MSTVVKQAHIHSDAQRALSERTTVIHPRAAVTQRRPRRGRNIFTVLGLLAALSTPVGADSPRPTSGDTRIRLHVDLEMGVHDRASLCAAIVLTVEVRPLVVVARYTVTVGLPSGVRTDRHLSVEAGDR